MKNIFTITKILIISIFASMILIGCGGGDSASFEDATVKISLDSIPCVTGTPSATDIGGYETLYSGDVLVKETDNTEITIYHDIDGLKKVCLVSGSAYILRK